MAEEAAACLRAVGFVDGTDDEGKAVLVMGTADAALLERAAALARARAAAYAGWPAPLHACLPAVCAAIEAEAAADGGAHAAADEAAGEAADALRGSPPSPPPAALLAALTEELAQPHIPQLLAHGDNQERVASQLQAGGAVAAARLLDNLVELRANLTAQQQQQPPPPPPPGPGGSGASRVRHIADAEEWYDVLEAAGDGLVVADFGATWCGPCQHVKPLFEELSSHPAYEGRVTFVSIDADQTPVLVGDNRVDSFPTFKFFRNSAEDELPVVGADIGEVRSKIDALLGAAPA